MKKGKAVAMRVVVQMAHTGCSSLLQLHRIEGTKFWSMYARLAFKRKKRNKMKAITVNWKLLGAELANLTCIEQADFFNGFIREMLTWDTHVARVMQCQYIRDKLDEKNIKFIEGIGAE